MKSFNTYPEFVKIINDLPNDEIVDFTLDRLNYLEDNTKVEEFDQSINLKRIYKGYIHSDTPIKVSNMVDPFYVDEISLYTDFLNFTKSKKEFENNLSIIYNIQSFVDNKFGHYGDQNNRINVYLKFENNREKQELFEDRLSISNFYNNNTALCIERSAVVQNLLSFVGIKSYLICNTLEVNEKKETHAYNIIQSKENKYLLFDVTNVLELSKKNDSTVYSSPAYVLLESKPTDFVEFDYNKTVISDEYHIINKTYRKYNIPYDLDKSFEESRKVL